MRLRLWGTVLVIGLALLAGGCGSNGDSSGNTGSSGESGSQGGSGGKTSTKVKVALLPIADVLPIYAGMKEGLFADEGIEIEPLPTDGGGPGIPATLAGEVQFGFSNPVSVMQAAEKGLPVVVVANANIVGDTKRQVSVLAVKGDSAIRRAADLNGKTIGISSLNNISEAVVRNAIDQGGGDPSQARFIEIPMPEMGAALQAGRVDAVSTAEPYTTTILDEGARAVLEPYRELPPQTSVAVYYTSRSYAEQHPDVIKGFVRAMNKSLEYTEKHEQEARSLLESYTKIDPDLAKRISLWSWRPELTPDSLTPTGNLAVEYGLLEKAPDFQALLLEP